MDQAEKLRKIINHHFIKTTQKNIHEILPETPQIPSLDFVRKKTKVFAITSGKGGVGKTNLTLNLALALLELKARVVVIDADFGLANIEVVLGYSPQHTLLDVVQKKKNLLEIICMGPNQLRFISGGVGITELSTLSSEDTLRFIQNMSLLDSLYDFVLVDTGAGVSANVLNFVLAADEVLVVTTPEPTSITDAYSLLKMVSKSKNQSVIQLLVNKAKHDQEAVQVFQKLKEVSDRFLNIKLNYLGWLPQDDVVERAVRSQQPFLVSHPRSNISKQIRIIGEKILFKNHKDKQEDEQQGAKRFIGNFIKRIRGEALDV